ncbi:MAG: ACT domain-containing protein [Ruminococcaceae bacterium]|nr:ACT domain-containing protein [Oscillospiraceae bacterium]
MKLQKLNLDLTVCKVSSEKEIDMNMDFYFIGKTHEEISLVCPTKEAPANTIEREDGWRAFRIKGTLDFALVGILSRISTILADNKIGIFAVSTYNTDYILVKKDNWERALAVLEDKGYEVDSICIK